MPDRTATDQRKAETSFIAARQTTAGLMCAAVWRPTDRPAVSCGGRRLAGGGVESGQSRHPGDAAQHLGEVAAEPRVHPVLTMNLLN